MAKRYIVPFAETGDKTEIPESTVDGTINNQQGYGGKYEADPAVDPTALFPEREKFNQLFNDVTGNIKHWQDNCFPPYFSAAENGGVAVAYPKGATVTYLGEIKASKVDNNTSSPDSSDWEVLIDKSYADTGDATTLQAAKDYTNTEIAKIDAVSQTYVDQKDGETLQAAKDYADTVKSKVFTLAGLGLSNDSFAGMTNPFEVANLIVARLGSKLSSDGQAGDIGSDYRVSDVIDSTTNNILQIIPNGLSSSLEVVLTRRSGLSSIDGAEMTAKSFTEKGLTGSYPEIFRFTWNNGNETDTGEWRTYSASPSRIRRPISGIMNNVTYYNVSDFDIGISYAASFSQGSQARGCISGSWTIIEMEASPGTEVLTGYSEIPSGASYWIYGYSGGDFITQLTDQASLSTTPPSARSTQGMYKQDKDGETSYFDPSNLEAYISKFKSGSDEKVDYLAKYLEDNGITLITQEQFELETAPTAEEVEKANLARYNYLLSKKTALLAQIEANDIDTATARSVNGSHAKKIAAIDAELNAI